MHFVGNIEIETAPDRASPVEGGYTSKPGEALATEGPGVGIRQLSVASPLGPRAPEPTGCR
jgi:hypothetical protein